MRSKGISQGAKGGNMIASNMQATGSDMIVVGMAYSHISLQDLR